VEVRYTLTIPGPPVAKQRPRRAPGGQWYTPKRTVDAETYIGECLMVAGVTLEPDREYAIEVTYYLTTRRSDLDNLTKLTLDGIGRYGGRDGWNDRQVTSLVVRCVGVKDASEERTELTIRGL